MQWTDLYDFHAVSFVAPLLLTAAYAAVVKKWKLFWVMIFLALLTKEQVSLIVAGLGFILAVCQKEWKKGALLVVVGMTWFLAMIFIAIPSSSSSNTHWALSLFDTTQEINKNNSANLSIRLNKFTTEESLSYIDTLLRQFGYLPLIAFPLLLPAIPDIAINLLSSMGTMRTITYHYDSGTLPFLVLATTYSFVVIRSIVRRVSFLRRFEHVILLFMAVYLLTFGLKMNYNYSPLPTTPWCWCQMYMPSNEDREFEKILQKIPQTSSITASNEIRPHLTHRDKIYNVPYATDSADFIALLTQNRIPGNYNPKEYELGLINSLEKNTKYKKIYQGEYLYLFEKNKEIE